MHKKRRVGGDNSEPIENCSKITTKLPKAAYNSKVTKFKLDEDNLQQWVYFLSIIDSLFKNGSKFKETCIIFMDYTYKGKEDVPYYPKQTTRKLSCA